MLVLQWTACPLKQKLMCDESSASCETWNHLESWGWRWVEEVGPSATWFKCQIAMAPAPLVMVTLVVLMSPVAPIPPVALRPVVVGTLGMAWAPLLTLLPVVPRPPVAL